MAKYRVTERVSRDLEVKQYGVQVYDVEADNEEEAKEMSPDEGELVSKTWDAVTQEVIDEAIQEADENDYHEYEETISIVQTGDSSTDHMFVKVVYKGKVDEVMISRKGVIREALKAANISLRDVVGLTITGIACCADTQLRPDDMVYVD